MLRRLRAAGASRFTVGLGDTLALRRFAAGGTRLRHGGGYWARLRWADEEISEGQEKTFTHTVPTPTTILPLVPHPVLIPSNYTHTHTPTRAHTLPHTGSHTRWFTPAHTHTLTARTPLWLHTVCIPRYTFAHTLTYPCAGFYARTFTTPICLPHHTHPPCTHIVRDHHTHCTRSTVLPATFGLPHMVGLVTAHTHTFV